ncbi:MAG: Fe-S cluster assembly protein SufD [Rhodospirillaceae bacterium]|nr:Fe-S cluster assembly protein SufD [Rhodospirillaceae bacterium]
MTDRTLLLDKIGGAGLPTPRVESWKYTDLKALARLNPVLADANSGQSITAVPTGTLPEIEAAQIVLTNGELRPDLSDLTALPEGVTVEETDAPAPPEFWREDALVGLAPGTAIAIRVAKGVEASKPLHVISIASGDAMAIRPSVTVSLGEAAQLVLIESHIGDGTYFTNVTANVTLARAAALGHYKLQADGRSAFHIARTALTLGDNTEYDGFRLSTGGTLARDEIRATLDGSHIEARLNGAYMAGDGQHIDTTSFIDHAKPECRSHQVFKGVLDAGGRGVFQGKILVRPDAQKTDGYQMNRALMLSPDAEIDSKPELEIYADDVKCSHGATIGELEENQLFYLMARGIPRDRARHLLIEAYLADAVEHVGHEPTRAAFQKTISAWLQHHDGTPETLEIRGART